MEHKNRKIMCPDCGIVMQWTAFDNPVVMKLCVDCHMKHFQSGNKCAVCGEPATKYIQAFYDNGTVAQQYFCITHNFLTIQEEFRGLDALIRASGYVDGDTSMTPDVAQSYRDRMLGISPEEYKKMTHGDFQAVDEERKRILKLKPDTVEKKGDMLLAYGSFGIEPHFPQQLTFDEAKEMSDEMWEKLSEVMAPDMDDDKVYVVPDTEHTGNLWSKWMAQVVKDHIEDDELPHHTFEAGRDTYLLLGTVGIEEVISKMGIEVKSEEEE